MLFCSLCVTTITVLLLILLLLLFCILSRRSPRALGKAASLALKHSLLGLLYITADRMPIPGKYLLIRTSIMPQRH